MRQMKAKKQWKLTKEEHRELATKLHYMRKSLRSIDAWLTAIYNFKFEEIKQMIKALTNLLIRLDNRYRYEYPRSYGLRSFYITGKE